MQSNQIKKWVKANKLLSAIIIGAIIVVIILYLGANKQVPEAEEQPEKAALETPVGEAAEAPIGEVAAPETASEEAPPAETTEEVPPEGPVGTEESTEGGTA